MPPSHNEARRQLGHHLQQGIALDRRAHKHRLTPLIHAMHSKNVLGEINADRNNGHGLPLPSDSMRFRNPIVALDAVRRKPRLARDGEVPFIR